MADHRGQHRQRDIVRVADPDAGHHQIEEHVDTGAQFGHAGKVLGRMGRRRRSDAHDRAGQTGFAQRPGGGYGRVTFLSREYGMGG